MRVRELTGKNIDENYLGKDPAENLGRAFFRGLVAEEGDGIAGALIWEYHNLEEEWDTESSIRFFRVENEEAAEELMDAYTESVRQEDTVWTHMTIPVEDGKKEKKFLKKSGFQVKLTESDQIIVSEAELMTLPIMKSMKLPEDVLPLSEISVRQFRKGTALCLERGKTGLCNDLRYLPMSYFDRDLSCCYERDGELNSFFLVHRMPSGLLSVRLMVSFDKDFRRILPRMMRFFVLCAKDKFGSKAKIHLDRHNEASLTLSEKLLPRHFGTPVYAATRKEEGAVEREKRPTDLDRYILMF